MFNALSALIHDFRVCGQSCRHTVQNGLICVPCDFLEGGICTAWPQAARLAGFGVHKADGVIVADLAFVFRGQLLATWTDQDVCISIIMELLFCEEPILDGRAAKRLWNIRRDASGLTIFDVFNLVVTPVSNNIDMIDAQVLPRSIGGLRQQPQVTDFVMDLLLCDQLVLGIDGDLDVVANPNTLEECIARASGSVSDI